MAGKNGKINFSSIEHLSSEEKKKLTSSSNIKSAKEGIQEISKAFKKTITPDDPSAMIKTTYVSVREKDAMQAMDALSEQNRDLKNKCKTFQDILTTTKKRACLALAIASAISTLGGYSLANYNIEKGNQNQQFVIENTNYDNAYDYSELYDNTNKFLKSALLEQVIQDRPDLQNSLDHAIVESFEEGSGHNAFDVNIIENYNIVNRRHAITVSVSVDDPTMNVYNKFRDMRKLSNRVPENEQDSVSYMLQVNSETIDLVNALNDYKNENNKSLEKSAQDVVKDSRVHDDGEEK